MNLTALIDSHASPCVMLHQLETKFDVLTVADDLVPWFDFRCLDASQRVRLVIRYQWQPGGWVYHLIPVRRRRRRPVMPGDVTYRPDGSYSIAA